MLDRQWKVPWTMIKLIEDIWCKLHIVQRKVTHIFREGNTVVDALANEVIDLQETREFFCFMDLPTNIKGALT